jgi:hypothetical protein
MTDWIDALLAVLALAVATSTTASTPPPTGGWTTIALSDGALA